MNWDLVRVVHYFTCTSSVYRGIGWKKHENYKPQTAKSLFLASDLKLQKTILSKVKAEQSHEMWLNTSWIMFENGAYNNVSIGFQSLGTFLVNL